MRLPTVPSMSGWRQKLETYGKLGLYVYLTIYVTSLVAFTVALESGMQDRVPWIAEHAGSSATFVAAWVLTKVIQVPRILLTLAVTPVVARVMGRDAPVVTEPAG